MYFRENNSPMLSALEAETVLNVDVKVISGFVDAFSEDNVRTVVLLLGLDNLVGIVFGLKYRHKIISAFSITTILIKLDY